MLPPTSHPPFANHHHQHSLGCSKSTFQIMDPKEKATPKQQPAKYSAPAPTSHPVHGRNDTGRMALCRIPGFITPTPAHAQRQRSETVFFLSFRSYALTVLCFNNSQILSCNFHVQPLFTSDAIPLSHTSQSDHKSSYPAPNLHVEPCIYLIHTCFLF